jgi:hypothetical protein
MYPLVADPLRRRYRSLKCLHDVHLRKGARAKRHLQANYHMAAKEIEIDVYVKIN